MAKPLRATKLKPDMPVSKAAGILVGVKVRELWLRVDLVRKGDIEGVHDMRVSAKRLRETLRIFKPVIPKNARSSVDDTNELNDALGEVRDRDVLLQHLEALGRDRPDEAACLVEAIRDLASEREAHFATLMGVLDDQLGKRQTPKALRHLAKALAGPSHGPGRAPLREFAHVAIAQRAAPVFADTAAAKDPANPLAFHALRILVKRLKYAIEPFLEILPPSMGRVYSQVSELQELMGNVHDDDVLIDVLEKRALEGLTTADCAPMLGHLREARHERHTHAVALLTQMEDADLQQTLLDALD
jgi:CHAD domain-containing protein